MLFCAAGLMHAGVVGYTLNPTGNSADFASGVASAGGTLLGTISWEDHALGTLDPNHYAGMKVSFDTTAVVTDSLSVGGSLTSPNSSGEGLAAADHHISPDSPAFSMTVDFADSVLGFGFYLIDFYNPGGANPATLQAYSGPGGTGTLLGTFGTAPYNFQLNYKYFLGVVSTDSDIRSVVFTTPGFAGDGVFLDDFQITDSGVPEPGTSLLAGGGLLLAWLRLRRR